MQDLKTVSFEVFGISDIGLMRQQNEDAWAIDPDKGIFILADGIGGHKAGEVASNLSVETLLKNLAKKNKIDSTVLLKAFSEVNELVYKRSCLQKELQGMGTTLICLTFSENKAFFAHVGDSRLYLHRNHLLKQVTKDHSLYNELLSEGAINKNSKDKTYKNILTKAIGTQVTVETSVDKLPLQPKDLFLLCSDGLSNYVEDKIIEEILNRNLSLENKGKSLVELAKINRGGDNITLILVQIY